MKHLILAMALLLVAACSRGGGADLGNGGGITPAVTAVNNRALLSWSSGSGMADGYFVEQSTDNSTWTQIQAVVETSTYIDGLTLGTTYYFRVRSHNSTGNSPYSGSVKISL
ncbi:MAG: fibronectin type III domain-containing protein [Bdellovibrionota bacterium]